MSVQFIWNRNRTKCYVYAYKGGPRILTHEGTRRPRLGPKEHAAIAKALAAKEAPADEDKFSTVLREWQKSADFEAMAASTHRVWSTHIILIEEKWGRFPNTIWDDPRMASKVVKWRDERKDTPRTADIGITVLRALLKWAKLNGFIKLNVATDIPQLYRGSDREEIVWTGEDMDAFEAKAIELERPHLIDGLRLAALTGMRRADLVSLTFDHVGEFAVSKLALKKSKGRRRKAVIPMTPDLETFLDEMRTRERAEGVNTILVNSFGRSWSESGFGGSFNRIRDAAKIKHIEQDGVERLKHLHDVRGTFCTMLLADCGLTDQEAAEIMAWSPARVGQIRRTYVDGARVVVAIGERIAKRKAKHP